MIGQPHSTIEQVLRLFAERGDSRYGGEMVSQREHALQAADFARRADAAPALIAAALLHDIGHLLHVLSDDAPAEGIDDRHEELGGRWLQRRFGPAVVEPVRLHVDAKRFLCAVDEQYQSQLSEPSLLSLRLQGGPMAADEVERFRALPFAEDAVSLRRWDDAAKIPHLEVPPIEAYLDALESALAAPLMEYGA